MEKRILGTIIALMFDDKDKYAKEVELLQLFPQDDDIAKALETEPQNLVKLFHALKNVNAETVHKNIVACVDALCKIDRQKYLP